MKKNLIENWTFDFYRGNNVSSNNRYLVLEFKQCYLPSIRKTEIISRKINLLNFFRDAEENDVSTGTYFVSLIPLLLGIVYILCWFVVFKLWRKMRLRDNQIYVCVDWFSYDFNALVIQNVCHVFPVLCDWKIYLMKNASHRHYKKVHCFFLKNEPSLASFSFIFVFSNKHYNFYNK